jgi:hypothetical protein
MRCARLFAVGVLPAAIAAGLVGLALRFLAGAAGAVSVIVPAIVAVVVMFTEAWIASEAVGKMLDRTDLSAIDAQE